MEVFGGFGEKMSNEEEEVRNNCVRNVLMHFFLKGGRRSFFQRRQATWPNQIKMA